MPLILSSAAYLNGGVLFTTWDEASSSDGPIGMIVLSPYARRGYANWTYINHGATLRTIEEIFGLQPPLPKDLGQLADLSAFFTTFP